MRPSLTSRTCPPRPSRRRARLAAKTLVVAGEGLQLTRSLAHGHLGAISVMAKSLGLANLLSPASYERSWPSPSGGLTRHWRGPWGWPQLSGDASRAWPRLPLAFPASIYIKGGRSVTLG
ncbi:MAG: hypothetical protein ACYCPT_00015 [Acidimicrobiales bacterium]